jgi:SpoU rRNA methylase family enzyme
LYNQNNGRESAAQTIIETNCTASREKLLSLIFPELSEAMRALNPANFFFLRIFDIIEKNTYPAAISKQPLKSDEYSPSDNSAPNSKKGVSSI